MSEGGSWFARLKAGLSKTSEKLADGIGEIFTHRKLDLAMLGELEELLITSDIGTSASAHIVQEFGRERFDKEIAPEEVKQALSQQIAAILEPVARSLEVDATKKPHVILVVGVNGNGKTTTIGKMAKQLQQNGFSVMLAAADTFRAAAVEQLRIWAERNGCPIVTAPEGTDPASVAYQAIEEAKEKAVDVLLIDSAGRLHTKQNLMQELQKMVRVMQKIDPTAPHNIVQVIDATTGQNALQQVEAFRQITPVSGLVVTKLDGSAKGGIVVAIAKATGLPIHAVGVGEGIDDLRPFNALDFARNLIGLDKVA